MTPRRARLNAAFVVVVILLGNVAGAGETLPLAEAQKLYAKKDWAAAAKLYDSLAKADPAKGRYWYRLATCRLRLRDYPAALANFETALGCGAPEGPTRYSMACAYARLAEKDAALSALEKSVAAGFVTARVLKQDQDLADLRGESRFKTLVERLENPTKGLKGADALDHWIGEWDVYVDGQLVGNNRIVKTLDGFAVEEFWETRDGRAGRSFFVFDATKGTWKQLWTSDTGWIVEKTGTPIENGILLEGVSRDTDGTPKKAREHLTRNPDGSVRQLLEDWDEKAKTWKVTFDGKYVRKAAVTK